MRLYVPLTRDEVAKLRSLADRERRRPQDQAAHLLAIALAGGDGPPDLRCVGAEPEVPDVAS